MPRAGGRVPGTQGIRMLVCGAGGQQPGAAGCNYALQLQRKFWLGERVLGLAAHWLLGFKEQWSQKRVAAAEHTQGSRVRMKAGKKKG